MKTVLVYAIGGLLGLAAGFFYYRFVGCSTGTCPITSNPFSASIYGAVIGVLLASSIAK